MWSIASEQKRFSVGKIAVGGRLGENPTVLVGSVFYYRQKSLDFEEKTGKFNQRECERLIKVQEEFSDKTGLPSMLDVVLPSRKWASDVLDFVTSITDSPMFLDAASAEIRLAALDYANQIGILDRCVYNSLSPESRAAEFEKIEEVGLKSAVLLAFDAKNMTAAGRVAAVEQLMPSIIQSGIEKIFVDAAVLDVPTLGSAFRAIFEIKNKFGYPSGCGAHNAIGTWKGLKTKMGIQAVRPCSAVANAFTVAAGADWILYGPIEGAPFVFPSVAMVNAAFAQLLMETGKVPSPSHPVFRIA